jgi:hypothetical protein
VRSRANASTGPWTLGPITGDMLSLNDRPHWSKRHKITKQWRGDAATLAKAAQVPQLQRIRVVIEWLPPDRGRRDSANLAPVAKAIVDGLVDAGVVPDDDHTHLLGPLVEMGPVTKPAVRTPRSCCVRIHITPEPEVSRP